MARDNFRAHQPMDVSNSLTNEIRDQAKGLGRYVDTVRLLGGDEGKSDGWDFLKHYYRKMHLSIESGVDQRCAAFGDERVRTKSDYQPKQSQDCELFMLSQSAGINIVPLLHFWGVHPDNYALIQEQLERHGVKNDLRVCQHIEKYKQVVVKNKKQFEQLYLALWPSHYAHFVVNESTLSPGDPEHSGGWFYARKGSYNESIAAESRVAIDRILETYYPQGCSEAE